MEAGDGAAGDGDEDEREDLARDDRAAAVHELAMTASIFSSGLTIMMPTTSTAMVPSFMYADR